MFEAVNSVLSNAPLVRGAIEQSSVAKPVSFDVGTGPTAPSAPYISPYISIDLNFDKAVLQIRDSDTGDVLTQFPSEETLAARQRRLDSQQRAETPSSSLRNVSSNSFADAGQIVSLQTAPARAPVRTPDVQVAPQVAASVLQSTASSTPRAQAVSIQA
jgi:hypothetical protein